MKDIEADAKIRALFQSQHVIHSAEDAQFAKKIMSKIPLSGQAPQKNTAALIAKALVYAGLVLIVLLIPPALKILQVNLPEYNLQMQENFKATLVGCAIIFMLFWKLNDQRHSLI